MRWSNLFVIFRREVRDQIRDRRTLFMIFVLPILLYPILGIGVIQFASALEQKPRLVVVVGAEYLPTLARLLNPDGDGFNPALFDSPAEAERMVVRREPASGPWGDPRAREQAIRDGRASAVMVIPRDLPAAAPARDATRSTSRSSTTASTSPARSPICGSARCSTGGGRASSTGRLEARSEDPELHRADPGQGRGRGDRAARSGEASGAGSSRSCS